ncbi:MAG: ribosome small subunit-dependent GTPase A [Planctomycetes bacterium]|nr:ribosome small subunit-dependent GTPase A [Planctomycetota bacterium]
MSPPSRKRKGKAGKKVRISLRRNRAKRPRQSDWTQQERDGKDRLIDTERSESLAGKGALSRRRTVIIPDDASCEQNQLPVGVVVAMRGLFADVDDGEQIRTCTVRRMLRTRLIRERHPVTVGDRVRFRMPPEAKGVVREGVIEAVEPRAGQLRRLVNRRIHTIVANVDQAIIVSSAAEPSLKPHLIDRYIVASHAGDIKPIVCINKCDLAAGDETPQVAQRYRDLGYAMVCTSVLTGEGIDELRSLLKDKSSVIAGQSGVGKSSLLNAIQSGLKLQVGDIVEQTQKGRHTTTTALLHRLDVGGYVIDTPGVKSFDLSIVDRDEFEAYFVEFIERVKDCKFPDCTHTHEIQCSIKQAVEDGEIHPDRYESYVRMFEEPTEPDWQRRPSE